MTFFMDSSCRSLKVKPYYLLLIFSSFHEEIHNNRDL